MSYIGIKYLPLYFTLCTGILSHLLLLICLIKDPLKCFRNSATYFIMNLALSDFLVCTVGLLRTIFGEKISAVGHISDTAMLGSMFSIFSIAIDRYMLTVHPFKHRALLNGRIIAIWIVSMWVPSFYPLVKILIIGPDRKMDRLIYEIVFMIFLSVTFFIYTLTYFTLKKREREISQQQSQSRNRILQQAFLKTIMIVAFVQFLTLVPACIQGMVNSWSSTEFSIVDYIVYELYCLNFALNPFLYVWRLKNYRETFRLLFCGKLC